MKKYEVRAIRLNKEILAKFETLPVFEKHQEITLSMKINHVIETYTDTILSIHNGNSPKIKKLKKYLF